VAERRKARVEVGVGIFARSSMGRGRGRGCGWGVVFRCWSDGGSEGRIGWLVGLVCGLIQYMYIYVYALPPCFASWICGYDLIGRWFDAQMIRLSNFDR
jgi:hypothetical protein